MMLPIWFKTFTCPMCERQIFASLALDTKDNSTRLLSNIDDHIDCTIVADLIRTIVVDFHKEYPNASDGDLSSTTG